MRRIDREIIDKNEIYDIIKKSLVCRLGLSDNNMPYIVAMNFGFIESNPAILYFHSANEGKKIDIIKVNNNVCVQIDIPGELVKSDIACNWGMNYKSVIIFGKAEIIIDKAEKVTGLNSIMKKYSGKNDYFFDEKNLNQTTVFKVVINEITCKKKG
jgi:uncharacterized protein